MKVLVQILVRRSELLRIARSPSVIGFQSELLCVLHCGWYFDRASETKIGVALAVGELLNFSFGEWRGVHHNFVVNWQCRGRTRIVVGDKEKVKCRSWSAA